MTEYAALHMHIAEQIINNSPMLSEKKHPTRKKTKGTERVDDRAHVCKVIFWSKMGQNRKRKTPDMYL